MIYDWKFKVNKFTKNVEGDEIDASFNPGCIGDPSVTAAIISFKSRDYIDTETNQKGTLEFGFLRDGITYYDGTKDGKPTKVPENLLRLQKEFVNGLPTQNERLNSIIFENFKEGQYKIGMPFPGYDESAYQDYSLELSLENEESDSDEPRELNFDY
jgi:hypothetical protein